MYLLADACATMPCSPQDAFAFAADLAHFPAWFPGVARVVSSDGLAFDAVGKRYTETLALSARRPAQVQIRVVDVTPGVCLVTEGTLPLIRPRMEMRFRSSPGGQCVVHWQMFSRSTSPLARWTLLPFARRVMTRRARLGLQNLQGLLERRAAR